MKSSKLLLIILPISGLFLYMFSFIVIFFVPLVYIFNFYVIKSLVKRNILNIRGLSSNNIAFLYIIIPMCILLLQMFYLVITYKSYNLIGESVIINSLWLINFSIVKYSSGKIRASL